MKKSLLLVITILTCIGSSLLIYEAKADTCGGRCTGSAYCTACKNCTGCKHCNSGGSCGVCKTNNTKPPAKKKFPTVKKSQTLKIDKTTASPKKPNPTNSSSTKPKSTLSSPSSNIRKVRVTKLNVRKEPLDNAPIICVLTNKKSVRILNELNNIWLEIEAFCDNNRHIRGYVHKVSLN